MKLNFQARPCTKRPALGLSQHMALPEGSTAAASSTIHTQPLPRHATLRGFTLLELLVVIGLIAALAVIATSQLDDAGDHAKEQIARAEMANISKALKQYKRDVGSYPKSEDTNDRERQHPADFTFLITGELWDDDSSNYVALPEEDKWDPESARGWRGPYLDNAGNGYVSVGDNLKFDGDGSPTAGNTKQMLSVGDPFARLPVDIDDDGDFDYFLWRPCADCEQFGGEKNPEARGRPYYLFDLDDPKKARLVSAGPNGLLEAGVLAAASCADIYDTATGDDLILCLQ
jgi:prepilin-type N-terminal cleavage/methylation domain-containing protein